MDGVLLWVVHGQLAKKFSFQRAQGLLLLLLFLLIWKAQSFSILYIQDEPNPVEFD